MLNDKRRRMALGAVALLGLFALVQRWVAQHRPLSPQLGGASEFQVTSEADGGPGSLREAIFAADTARQRARIIVRAANVRLQSPLPPLVNPLGVVVETGGNQAGIDAANAGPSPIFDISAPNSVISGIRISNAPEQAVLVRSNGLRVSNITLGGCDTGVYAVDGITDLVIENSSFENNRIGIWITNGDAGVIIRNNHFSSHKDAGVWAVRGSELDLSQTSRLQVKGNHFIGDRMSVVLGNVPVLVAGNEFAQAREAAVYLLGQGAIVRENRIRNGAGMGVFAQGSQGAVIENNELDHNRALAVLVRSSGNDLIQKNRVYDNGYGIGFVLGERERPSVASENMLLGQLFDGIIVIGDSPILRGNRAMNNSLAGVRVLDFLPLNGNRVTSNPFLENNRLEGNKLNQPIRGDYRVGRTERAQ